MRRFAPLMLLLLATVLSGCLPFMSSGYGSISVSSVPEQASVWLDGKETNEKTPVVLDHVRVGRRKVEVRFPGMDPASADVVVRRSQQANLTLTLHPKGTSPRASDEASVYGTVLENRGGSPVEGATVRAYTFGTSKVVATTTTDDEGAYGFNLPPGTYDIVVTKSEHAEAKRQALTVNVGDDERVDIILKPLFDQSKSAVAPSLSVTYDRGDGVYVPFEPGTVISNPTPVRVKIDAVHPVEMARAWVGHWNVNPPIRLYNQSNLEFDLGDEYGGIPFEVIGETELIVDAYDIQGNWVELRIPFVVRKASVPTPQPRVTGVDLTAVTYGADLGLFRTARAAAYQQLGLSGNPDTLRLDKGTVIDMASLRQDVTTYVIVRWNPVASAHGYEIQRAWSEAGPWRQIGRVSALFFGGTDYPYLDMSADLQPGLKVFYRIRAVGPSGELGEWSTPVSVTPLERFEVRLVEPKDGAVGVSLNPTFRWEYDDVGAEDYLFTGGVLGVTVDVRDFTWIFEDLNVTEAPFNYNGTAIELLKPAKTYSWSIIEAEARSTYGLNSRAIAFSGQDIGAVNGVFNFTTGYDD